MTSRVILISPASNPSLRQARFDDGRTPLDESGTARAGAAAWTPRSPARVLTSPSLRCRETAAALGLREGDPLAELAGLHVGRWQGRTLDEVGSAEPEAVAQWLADPASAPHGGESVQQLCSRIGQWLDSEYVADDRTIAVVEPDVVRAVVVQVSQAPPTVFWRIDVAPLTATEISGRAGRWNLRVGRPLGGRDTDG
ncbi:histidine phosphatase family protein [Streptomyces sp. NPDC094149]|uniref:histidine phosphatase family protein n=1 Tax=Streptomyces sp. NPDC094149 TaxID=3155079 RepID=UPI0033343983